MTLNKKSLFLSNFLLFVITSMIVFSCAVPQRPQGGPKDVSPPKLLKATPRNLSHNFTSKVIQLDFDEYIKLNNQYQEITVSPTQEKTPTYAWKKNILTITLKDTLLKNTTYVINFGKAIADVNEGNVLKNFTYVFSTGTHIDSLSISGNVINIQTQLKEKDVTVMLFTLKQDSLYFGKKRPTVSTTTDTSGNFTLGNLHEGVYKLYALKEATPNKIYDNDNELIAFPTKTINLQGDSAGIQLRLFKQVPPKFRYTKQFDLDGKVLLTFNKPLERPVIHVLYPANLENDKYVEYSKTRDTALVYFKNMDFDSLRLAINDGAKPVDSVSLRKGRKESFIKQIISMRSNADAGMLKPGLDLNLLSSTPITSFDPGLIELKEDSTVVTDYTLTPDTANLKHFTLKYKWKQGANYILTFNEDALTGIFGEKNKKIPKKFKIDKPINYNQFTLKLTVPDTSKAYVVEVYTDQNQLLKSDFLRKNTTLTYKNYLSGKYRVKVIYDDNKNGKWDAGSIKENRQPENIWIYDKPVIVRPNLETIETLAIPREPSP